MHYAKFIIYRVANHVVCQCHAEDLCKNSCQDRMSISMSMSKTYDEN